MPSLFVAGILFAVLGMTDGAPLSTGAPTASEPSAGPMLPDLASPQLARLPRGTQPPQNEKMPGQTVTAALTHPFTLEYVLHWLFDHLPKLVMILLGSLALQMLLKGGGRQIAQIMSRGGSRGTQRERENRAVTLVAVFRN